LKKKRAVVWGIVVFLGLIIGMALVEPEFLPFTLLTKDRPDFEMQDVKIAYFANGKLQWVLASDHAQIDKSKHMGSFKTIKGHFISEGHPVLNLQSPLMKINLDSGEMRMVHTIATWNIEPFPVNITGKSFWWDEGKKELIGEGKIVLNNEEYNLTADEVRLELREERMTFIGEDAKLEFKKL
jgi:hypothetical protein